MMSCSDSLTVHAIIIIILLKIPLNENLNSHKATNSSDQRPQTA